MGTRPKKKARVEEEESEELEESEDEVYQVEYFKKAKVDDDGEWLYLVKWFGYNDPDDDTWEPEKHIADCQRLLASFWQEIGGDDNDYLPGYECAPSQAWINKEKVRFGRTNTGAKERIEIQKAKEAEQERKRRQKQTKKPAIAKSVIHGNRSKDTVSKKGSRESSSTNIRIKEELNDDVPVFPRNISKKAKSTRKIEKTTLISSESSSNSDSDRPLAQGKRKRPSTKVTSKAMEVEGNRKVESSSADGEKYVQATDDPASLFATEKPITHKQTTQSSEEAQTEISSHKSPATSVPNVFAQAETKPKPNLPRLPTVRPVAGPSAGKPASFPSLSKLNVPTPSLPKLSIPVQPKTDTPVSASNIFTKHRLMQGALQMTTPTEKVPEVWRPPPPQKPSSLSGMSFKKNRGPPVKASSTITAPTMSLQHTPMYSPPTTPSSSMTAPVTGVSSSLRQSFVGIGLPPNLSRKQYNEPDVQNLPPSLPQETQNKTLFVSAESYVPLDSQQVQLSHDTNIAPPAMFAPESRLPPISINTSTTLDKEAEHFLQSVMSTTETSGLEPPLPPKSPSSRRIPSVEDAIWTGRIILETEHKNELQTISIEGMLLPSDPPANQTAPVMPLKVAMAYNDSKLLMKSRSFYRLKDLDGIVAACTPVQEWGWLCAENEQDARKLRKIAGMLSHQTLVGFMPVEIDGNIPAIILISPSNLIHDKLPRVSIFGPDETVLIVSLYSWIVRQDDHSLEKTQKHFMHRLDNAWDRRDFKLPQGIYEAYGEPGIRSMEGLAGSKPTVKHAVRMLEFPELLHSYLTSGGERPFALWPPVDSEAFCSSPIPKIEREMLLALLKEYPATIDRGTVGKEQDPSLRVIFVHVNSLAPATGQGNIKDMPGLSGYRITNDARFIVYGSSDIVNPRFPDLMQEIWHIGGVVTFTANALLSDPLGINERIFKIAEHEFWVCYVSPAVIGMVVSIAYRERESTILKRIACNALEHGIRREIKTNSIVINVDEDEDAPVPCTCDGFAYEWLLDAIDEESISLIGAPPLHASDPLLGGHGAMVHRGVPRDGRLRRIEEWKQVSNNLLASSSSPAVSMNTMPPSSPPLSAVQDQLPPSSKEAQYNDPFASWILQLFDSDIRNRSETLAYCIEEFKRLCGNVPQDQWEDVLKREMMEELGRMQICMGFREELRRFVIVTGSEDKDLQTAKCGFEWVTAESFKFHDVTDNDLEYL
ncbi:hypothetical protein J3R30DRAFT_3509183 [Lentinula aciculospora]|uniref:Chromo domain-containing protein n=1 Tax=Lentinula aciculospora TaxID=153920 RepID=A0A9W9DKU3_9AGAR|nr:hypothetical protein J3R30DRAFT_3509183 [Lentinula aciculospora]